LRNPAFGIDELQNIIQGMLPICKIKDAAWQYILFKHGGLQDEKTID
jgi:hypothetical protein